MTSTLEREVIKAPRFDGKMRIAAAPARRAMAVCELNEVFDEVLTRYAEQHADKYIAPLSEGTMYVRIPPEVLERVLGLVLDGLISTGLWQDGESDCICPMICKCLNGYGAVLEVTNELTSLPQSLMTHFAKQEAAEPDEAGRQLLKARDLIERHGGRLHLSSPLSEYETGTTLRLYLPLAPRSAQSGRSEARREELLTGVLA